MFTYLDNPIFNAELFLKWSNANLSISKMSISLECLSINYMLPSAQAPLIFCWCGVPSCDYVVRRHLFCTPKYWWPNTIFHLEKVLMYFQMMVFAMFDVLKFCWPLDSSYRNTKRWRIHCFLFSRFSPIWHVIDYWINVKNAVSMSPWEYPPPKHTHTHALTKVKTLFTLNISTTQYKIIFLHQLSNTLLSARKDCTH